MLKLHLRSLQLLILFDNVSGDPYGIRTRVAAVKGRCPKPLDEGALCKTIIIETLLINQGSN